MNRVHGARVLSFTFSSLLIMLMLLCAGCAGGSRGAIVLSDDAGQTNIAGREAAAPNQSPEAVPAASPREGPPPLWVHFWDGGSYDPDGEIVKWEWFFDDRGGWEDFTETRGEAWHTYQQGGQRSPKLRVTDDGGKRDISSLLITVQTGANVQQAPWPMFGYNAARTRLSPYVGAQKNDIKWVFGTGLAVDTSPAIAADGTVYVGSNYRLWAINADGSFKWSYYTGGAWASPAVDEDGTAYVARWDGHLDALNPDGSVKWSYTTNAWIHLSSPAIGTDGTVYVGGYNTNFDHCYLYAVNSDGSLKWAYPIRTTQAPPTVGLDGTVYSTNWYGWLHAINPDGSLKWKVPTGGAYSAASIGDDGTIYFGGNDFIDINNGKLHAINPDGSFKWSYTVGAEIRTSPGIGADGTIFVAGKNGKLHAVNPDGSLKWIYTAGAIQSSPAIGADGTVYFGSFDNKLHAVDQDGILKWSYTTGDDIRWSSPAIGADGTVYVGSFDGHLYAFGSSS